MIFWEKTLKLNKNVPFAIQILEKCALLSVHQMFVGVVAFSTFFSLYEYSFEMQSVLIILTIFVYQLRYVLDVCAKLITFNLTFNQKQ